MMTGRIMLGRELAIDRSHLENPVSLGSCLALVDHVLYKNHHKDQYVWMRDPILAM